MSSRRRVFFTRDIGASRDSVRSDGADGAANATAVGSGPRPRRRAPPHRGVLVASRTGRPSPRVRRWTTKRTSEVTFALAFRNFPLARRFGAPPRALVLVPRNRSPAWVEPRKSMLGTTCPPVRACARARRVGRRRDPRPRPRCRLRAAASSGTRRRAARIRRLTDVARAERRVPTPPPLRDRRRVAAARVRDDAPRNAALSPRDASRTSPSGRARGSPGSPAPRAVEDAPRARSPPPTSAARRRATRSPPSPAIRLRRRRAARLGPPRRRRRAAARSRRSPATCPGSNACSPDRRTAVRCAETGAASARS